MDFMAIAVLGVAVSYIYAFVNRILKKPFGKKAEKEQTLDERINKLTFALKESSKIVAEIESEIQTRQKLVEELHEDTQRYEKLITLNQEQVDAVAQVLKGELRKENRASFWKAVGVNFIFFLLGAGASWYFSVGI